MESSHCSSTEASASAEPTSQQSEVLTRVFSLLKAAASTNDSSHDVTRSSSLEQHFVCCLKCKSATEQCKDLNKIGIFNFFRSFSTSSLIGELRLKIPFLLIVCHWGFWRFSLLLMILFSLDSSRHTNIVYFLFFISIFVSGIIFRDLIVRGFSWENCAAQKRDGNWKEVHGTHEEDSQGFLRSHIVDSFD